MGRRTKQTFVQRGHHNGQWAHEKTLTIANHQGNADQNHKELSPHTCQNGLRHQHKRNRAW